MTLRIYATHETRPVIITDMTTMTGYWLIDGQGWVKMHPAAVTQAMIIKDRQNLTEGPTCRRYLIDSST
jgi:hypothetical protein